MDFKKITNIIFVLILFFPLFYANAENKDYLAVDLQFNFASKQFSVLKIEQKIFETSDILEYENPTHSLSLVRNDKVISSVRFLAPQQQNYSATGEDGVHSDVGYLDIETMNLMLAINEPLDLASDRIEIKDGVNKIFTQNLNTIPIEVLSGTMPLIPETESDPSFQEPQTQKANITVAIIAGLLIVIMLGVAWYKHKHHA